MLAQARRHSGSRLSDSRVSYATPWSQVSWLPAMATRADTGFVCLACVGLVLTWECNLKMPLVRDIFLKPWVLLDSSYGPRVVSTFFHEQGSNTTTTAVCVNFLLAIGLIIITNCRATSGELGKRMMFHYLGMAVAVAFSFPLQCALCEQPQMPPADGLLVWSSTLIFGGVGAYVLLGTRSTASTNLWYFVFSAVVPFIYDQVAPRSLSASLHALGIVNLLICVALWANALWQQDGSPFATPATTSIFWDLVVASLCSCAWIARHVGDHGLALLGLACPAAGLAFAFARLAEGSPEGYASIDKTCSPA